MGFTELGAWTEWHGTKRQASRTEEIRDKIEDFWECFIDGPLDKEDIEIIDFPKKKEFSFVDKRNKTEVFNISMEELKYLPKRVREEFSVFDKNVGKIIDKLTLCFV